MSGCIPKNDIYNNTYILEKRISLELEKIYSKRRDFFDVKVLDFSIIDKRNQESICKAKIYYRISNSYLCEYNELLKLGKNANLIFKRMDNYERLNYDLLKNNDSDRDIVFSIVSDPKKGGNCLRFDQKISTLLLITKFDTKLFRDFLNLNRPFLDNSISKNSPGQSDALQIISYLKVKGFPYESESETYSNKDSSLRIVYEDTKTLFILKSPRVFAYLEHLKTNNSKENSYEQPRSFTITKIKSKKEIR